MRFGPGVTKTDHNLRFDSKSTDAMVVFGFSSKRSVWLAPGVDDGVSWHCIRPSKITRIEPDGGFIVARLPARIGKETYAIVATSSDHNVEVQGPVANESVWVFTAEPGKVSYLGGLRLGPWSDRGPSILADETYKQSEADDFLTQTFPNVPIHVTTGRMDAAYMGTDASNGCY